MTSFLVCFNLGLPFPDQQQQIINWLSFLNSSLALPSSPTTVGATPKWSIIMVGLCSDQQQDFSITQDLQFISRLKKKWPRLPIAPTLFTVSSLHSVESVEALLKFQDQECGRILDTHATQIPTSYHKFLSILPDTAKEHPLIHSQDLYKLLQPRLNMDEAAFNTMLRYLEAIGRIVWLPTTNTIFMDPTTAPKIAAKFISPNCNS
jgi:hypothetical protein